MRTLPTFAGVALPCKNPVAQKLTRLTPGPHLPNILGPVAITLSLQIKQPFPLVPPQKQNLFPFCPALCLSPQGNNTISSNPLSLLLTLTNLSVDYFNNNPNGRVGTKLCGHCRRKKVKVRNNQWMGSDFFSAFSIPGLHICLARRASDTTPTVASCARYHQELRSQHSWQNEHKKKLNPPQTTFPPPIPKNYTPREQQSRRNGRASDASS